MIILGIHDGHNSGATLLINGKIVSSVCEERITRNKNEIGYPKKSIDEVLSIVKINSSKIDRVVYATKFMPNPSYLSNFSKWYKNDYNNQLKDQKKNLKHLKNFFLKRKKERIEIASKHLQISKNKIGFTEHHLAHGAAAYYGSPFDLKETVLIMTCDGAGDGLSATVSIAKKGRIKRIAKTTRAASLGKIYSRVTYLLGFKPWEHEYKIMGLAPYSSKKSAEEIKNIFNKLLKLSNTGLGFSTVGKLQMSYIYKFLHKQLERKKFDAIAGGLQMFTEELLAAWVQKTIKRTGIRTIVLGGGVFMNVKANKIISQLKEVKRMFVFPSCGDESLSIGAAYNEYAKLNPKKIIKKKNSFNNPYLGRHFDDNEIFEILKRNKINNNCKILKSNNIEKDIADLLAQNKIVARFSGRMEWGARSLGNRSILANPSYWSNVEKINSMIKMRDFWMPFAPSILAEKSNEYIKNPKKIVSIFMMHAFDCVDKNTAKISATIHPRDKTARAQLVYKKINSSYWSLIKFFEKRTGCSAILNTSFNLHGYPVVNDPQNALYVFLNSGLKYMALGNYMIRKINKNIV